MWTTPNVFYVICVFNHTLDFSSFQYRTVDNHRVKLQLWDTAGQERFRAMAPMYYRKANAAFLVYDITSYQTFEHIKEWVEGKLHTKVHLQV